MASNARMGDFLGDYAYMRTVPASLSLAFILASLYQFGGIPAVELVWIGYTLTTEHAVIVSLGAFVFAFASSETTDFERYDGWEQLTIALGPALIIGQQYVTQVDEFLLSLGDPLGYQVAFSVTIGSWAVATAK